MEGTIRPSLIDVRGVAQLLRVSQSWLRRHIGELPAMKVGRFRIDAGLLLRQFQGKSSTGNRIEAERKPMILLRRSQQGHVYKAGKKTKTWYGIYREDVRKPDGRVVRRQRNIRLGTLSEFPTRAAASRELARRMGNSKALRTTMTFAELFDRWKTTIVPTLKQSTGDLYVYKLKRYVVPVFGSREVASITRY